MFSDIVCGEIKRVDPELELTQSDKAGVDLLRSAIAYVWVEKGLDTWPLQLFVHGVTGQLKFSAADVKRLRITSGALKKLLQPFEVNEVNLRRLEARLDQLEAHYEQASVQPRATAGESQPDEPALAVP